MRTSLFVAVCALSLASCAGTSPHVFNRVEPVAVVAPALPLDSQAGLPAYLVPAPAGSTPRQRRQWQKAQTQNLARAGVGPEKVKIRHSTLATAPGAVATTITKPTGPVATGPGSATDNTKAGQRGGAAAIGENAHAEATTKRGLSYWWLLVPVAALVYWQRKRVALLFL